jgi:hypothetical protein
MHCGIQGCAETLLRAAIHFIASLKQAVSIAAVIYWDRLSALI